MNDFLLVSGMMAVTFFLRYIMLPLSGRIEFPAVVATALRYVPVAVLSAIIFPSVFMPGSGPVDLSLDNSWLAGALVAFLVGWFSKNLLLTIVSGMGFFFFWQWVVTAVMT